jgi:hypothetical protein
MTADALRIHAALMRQIEREAGGGHVHRRLPGVPAVGHGAARRRA